MSDTKRENESKAIKLVATMAGLDLASAIILCRGVRETLRPKPSYTEIAQALQRSVRERVRPNEVKSLVQALRIGRDRGHQGSGISGSNETATVENAITPRRSVTIDESGFIMANEHVNERKVLDLGPVDWTKRRASSGVRAPEERMRTRFSAPGLAKKKRRKGNRPMVRESATSVCEEEKPEGPPPKKEVATGSAGTRTVCHICGASMNWGRLVPHLRAVHGTSLGAST